jgi:hypothetical protein
MKTKEQIQKEIASLERLGKRLANNASVQASVQGQIDVLMWVSDFECEVKAPQYA